MVKKRWYDDNSTLSMAVSILRNATASDQRKTADHILLWLEKENALNHPLLTHALTKTYLFPFQGRGTHESLTWRLLEILKQLPEDLQTETALQMIQYMYHLDSGLMPDNAQGLPETPEPSYSSSP